MIRALKHFSYHHHVPHVSLTTVYGHSPHLQTLGKLFSEVRVVYTLFSAFWNPSHLVKYTSCVKPFVNFHITPPPPF